MTLRKLHLENDDKGFITSIHPSPENMNFPPNIFILYRAFTPVPYALLFSIELFGAIFNANVCCVVCIVLGPPFGGNFSSETHFGND